MRQTHSRGSMYRDVETKAQQNTLPYYTHTNSTPLHSTWQCHIITIRLLYNESYGIEESRNRTASCSSAPHTHVRSSEVVQEARRIVVVYRGNRDVYYTPSPVKCWKWCVVLCGGAIEREWDYHLLVRDGGMRSTRKLSVSLCPPVCLWICLS